MGVMNVIGAMGCDTCHIDAMGAIRKQARQCVTVRDDCVGESET